MEDYRFQSATTIRARMNLAPPQSQQTLPAAMTSRPGNMTAPAPARNVNQALAQAAAAPNSGDLATASFWGADFIPAGAPPSPSAAAPTVAALPEGARTLAKIVPFVAAIFFWNKGDHVLAGVSAAAGAFAVWRL